MTITHDIDQTFTVGRLLADVVKRRATLIHRPTDIQVANGMATDLSKVKGSLAYLAGRQDVDITIDEVPAGLFVIYHGETS